MAGRLSFLWCIALLVVICVTAKEASADSAGDYREAGVVITASPHWKPYSFLNEDGEPAGFFIDYWEKWSEKMGIPVTFKLVPWSETIEMVANGQSDMQSGLYFTEERDRIFAFSKPVFYSKAVLVVTKDIPCELDLSSFKWGGVDGTVEKEHAEKLSSQDSIRSFENSRDLFAALARGEIQATVDDWSTVMLLGKEMGLMDSISICRAVYEKDLLAMVRKDKVELLQLIDDGISQITEDEKRFLVNKWFIGEDKGASWIWQSLPVAGLSILVVFGVWYFFKRRRG